MNKAQIKHKYRNFSIDVLRLYISAFVDLLEAKLIEEKLPIEHKEDIRQITIMEALERIK